MFCQPIAVLSNDSRLYGVAVLCDSASMVSTSARSGTPASAPRRVQLTAAAAFAKRSTCSDRPSLQMP